MIKDILQESWALALRDIKKNGGWKKYLLTGLISLAFILLLSLVLGKFFPQIDNNPNLYFISGVIGLILGMTSLAGVFALIDDKKRALRILLVSPISKVSILIGTVLSLIIALFKHSFIILILIMIYYGILDFSRAMLLIFAFFIIIFIFTGFGFIILSFINNPKTIQKFNIFFTTIFYLFSGILYPINLLPSYVKFLVYINPMTYAVELLRYILLNNSSIPLAVILLVNLSLALIFSLLGVYLFDRRLRLGLYH